jgi:UDP-N-acetylmuramoyl-tripeptide--D-alanyl-D-alanine ligase
VVESVSTDTRTLKPGDLFVGIRGENFDGNDYAADAARKGAAALLVSRRADAPQGVPQLVVRDTLRALGDMANLWRRTLEETPIAAIIGSNGKTTTKEMAADLVSGTLGTLVTAGNLNNLIGVPQMLCRLAHGHQAAILEMGMNQPGELTCLVEIAAPQCVALVNITNAHVGNFGGPEGLYQAKCEGIRSAGRAATLVMNADDPSSQRARREYAGNRRVINFGVEAPADISADQVEPLEPFGYRFRLRIRNETPLPVELRAYGRHNIHNALCAAAIARFLAVPAADIAARLTRFVPRLNRSEAEDISGWLVVKDYYNASPAAVTAALRSLADCDVKGRRYALLADMLELGSMEREFHAQVGAAAAAAGLDTLFTIGDRARTIHEAAVAAGARAEHLPDAQAAAARIRHTMQPGDILLIKGSRLMKLERVYEYLKGQPAERTP